MEKACRLYRGNFLPDSGAAPWSMSLRENLRDRYLRTVENFGSFLQRKGLLEQAVDSYRLALDEDPLIEGCYQRLMSCYHQMGRRADAIRVYNRCSEYLDAMLGLEPSAETQRLYQDIRNSP